MAFQVDPPILLNQNASIGVAANGDIVIASGSNDLPGSEYTLTAAGSILINGEPLSGGSAGASPVTLTAAGSVNVQTGVDGTGALFSFTADGKLLKDGVEFGGSAAPSGPGAWVAPILLSGWKNASTLNAYPMEPAKYRLNGDRLEFAGMLDGTAAAAPSQTNILFRLPASIANRISYQKTIQVVINGNVTGSLKILGNAVTYVAGVQGVAGGTATLNLGGCSATLDS